MKKKTNSLVGIIMGSKSDWAGTMEHCSETLKQFQIKHEVRVISAHRTPKRLHKFLKDAEKNKMEIIIAAAGMSAHLAGVTASLTTLPVLGVPTESKLKGLDSLLSTVQMPSGIPVGTLAIGKAGAINAAVLCAEIFSLFDGEIVQTAPTAGIVLVVFNRLLPHFKQLNTMRSTYAGLSSRIEQIGELVSKTGLAPVEQTVQSQYSSAPQIEFKNLSFSYPDSDQQAISSLSCLFQPGAINVVKGQSGSGKSTIMNVLAKLYVQTGGEIIVNGKEFDQIDKCAWLSNLGYVDQECFLLNSTIKENILFGRKGYSHQQIEEACELAEVTEFLKRLRSNFNTVVGDRGLSLSGGQRQRIVLARALLNNPRVLLLDEPTSALDLTTEEKFLETLVQIASDCTVIMASHRESTDKCADRIIEI